MAEAVLFFNEQGRVSKQMLFPEFEAMLDGVVNIAEFADEQMQAAYLLITPRLQIKSVVFFCLDFDEHGAPDRGWNVPLQSLAERAESGPDLGAGPVRLVSQRRCPQPIYLHYLWEPVEGDETRVLNELCEAVKRNSLGLLIESEQHPLASAQPMLDEHQLRSEREQRMKNAELLKQQRQLLNTLNQQHEEELAKVRQEAQAREQTLQAQVETLQVALQQQRAEHDALQAQMSAQVGSFQTSRQEMTEQLRLLELDAKAQADQLRAQLQREWQEKQDKALAHYKEQISIREAELAYLHEQDMQNQQEIQRLTQANAELLVQGGMRYLERLAGLGVMFVVYHPGAGHLTVPLAEISPYLDNPMGYAAAKCYVTEEQYCQWLDHYQKPICTASMPSGERCSIPVDRVDVPGRFIPGESNCCSRHKASSRMRSVG